MRNKLWIFLVPMLLLGVAACGQEEEEAEVVVPPPAETAPGEAGPVED